MPVCVFVTSEGLQEKTLERIRSVFVKSVNPPWEAMFLYQTVADTASWSGGGGEKMGKNTAMLWQDGKKTDSWKINIGTIQNKQSSQDTFQPSTPSPPPSTLSLPFFGFPPI